MERATLSHEPLDRRFQRMRAQLAQGGEIAQGVLRELFPGGFWLYPDPESKRYLWAHARTALADDWRDHLDADGHLPAEYWPRVYNAAAPAAEMAASGGKVVGNSMVAGACSVQIVRRSSPSPISIAAKFGGKRYQAIVAGDTR